MTFKFPMTIVAVRDFLNHGLAKLSGDTLGWLAAIVFHCATLPAFLALMTGLSDKTPSLDLILFLWGGLVLLILFQVPQFRSLFASLVGLVATPFLLLIGLLVR